MSVETKDLVKKEENQPTQKDEVQSVVATVQPWDEARVVVFMIGICLLIEGLLIYYQAGASQVLVAGVTGVGGVIMMLMAWLLPFETSDTNEDQTLNDTALLKEKEAEDNEEIIEAAPAAQPALETLNHVEAKPAVEVDDEKAKVESKAETDGPKTVVENQKSVTESKTDSQEVEKTEEPKLSWFQRLTNGLTKTRTGFVGKLKKLVLGTTKIDDDLMDELEETLFEADIGVKTTEELLDGLRKKVADEDIKDPQVIYDCLKDALRTKLGRYTEAPRMNPDGLTVFLVIGVNGVGKTTTIAKLANKFKNDGKKVMLAAGDTFRAAAIDQLRIWGDRVGVEVISGQEGGDPGALVFDAIHAAKKREADLLIIDTAGRMHVKANLMAELNKILKIAEKESNGGPHEILLVFDATTGQNAVQQAKQFREILPISGLVVTKLDGTAKGGVLFAVEEEVSVPVKFIGVGEKMEDLMPFEPEQFLEALFADDSDKKKESDYKVVK